MTAFRSSGGPGRGKRQTASFLIRRFEEVGIRPDTRKGQHFLIDLNLLQLLVDAAGLTRQDVILEVGTGLGSLTSLLASRAAWVITVEIDSRLQQLAAEQLAEHVNITMLRQDALKNKNHLHPEVMEAVRQELQKDPARRFKLVANLPYQIATPVVSNLLAADLPLCSMTVTIQKELADRLAARPWSKDYGALSVWVQSQCDTRIVRVLPPTVFWPRPKVHSAIVHLEASPSKRRRIPDPAFFHGFVRALFLHRRKLLRSALCAAWKTALPKSAVDRILESQRLAPEARAEQLDIDTLLALSESLRQCMLPGSRT